MLRISTTAKIVTFFDKLAVIRSLMVVLSAKKDLKVSVFAPVALSCSWFLTAKVAKVNTKGTRGILLVSCFAIR